MKGFGLGLIFSAIIKGIIRLFKLLFLVIADILLYFGLWVVGAYMLFAVCLMIWLGLDLNIAGVDTNLFYFGLALACLCSLIISVRNLILKPFKEFVEAQQVKSEYKRRKEESAKRELYRRRPNKYYAKYPEELPPVGHPIYTQDKKERKAPAPLIYRSEKDNDIIIHEYPDRFEIFREENHKIFHIDTKDKPRIKKGK